MNYKDEPAFSQALELMQAGAKNAAHAKLTQLSQAYPAEAGLWLWLAFTAPDATIARAAINQAAQIEPPNPALPGAYAWLEQLEPHNPESSVSQPVSVEELALHAATTIYSRPTEAGNSQDHFIARSSQAQTTQPDHTLPLPTESESESNFVQPQPNTRPPSQTSKPKQKPKKLNLLPIIGVVSGIGVIAFLLIFVLNDSAALSTNNTPRTFVSKAGGFSLTMPGEADQQSDKLKGAGFALNQYSYTVNMDWDNMSYTAVYFDLDYVTAQSAASNTHAYLDTIAKTYIQNISNSMVQNISLGAATGIDMAYVTSDGGTGKARFYYYGSRIYGIVYENKGNRSAPLDVDTFLNSFKFGTS